MSWNAVIDWGNGLWLNFLAPLGHWLWLFIGAPLAWFLWQLLKRLGKRYADGFEEAAGGYLKSSGQATFQRLLAFGFEAQYRQQLIHAFRTYEIQGLKTRGPFTLDLEKVFVPLRVAAESPQNTSSDLLRYREASKLLSIWDVLTAVGQQPGYRRVAVIGAPGSGKTTLLRHLALVHAQGRQRRYHRRARKGLPILLYLRDLWQPIEANPELDLAELIAAQKILQDLQPSSGWFKRRLRKGGCLVLLDGLDEVADASQRKAVGRWADRQMLAYPNACFFLTSRPFGYRDAQLERIGMVLEVQPFNVQQMGQFLDNWYLQNEVMRQVRQEDAGVRREAARKAQDLKTRILAHSALAAMAVNPLLLTMIATVHDNRGALPGRRVELYGEICDVLLGRRQEAKGLTDTLSAQQKQRVLQSLALALMEAGKRSFTLDEGRRYIAGRLARVVGPERSAADFLQQVENHCGMLVQRELGIYEFAHKSFQEYLAAVEIKDANLTEYLIDRLGDVTWQETIRLHVVQSNDASALISAMLGKPSVESLTLASDCLHEGTEIRADLREAWLQRVEMGLDSSNTEIARLAARVKLSERLKALTSLDERRWIDSKLLSCAEYQLFIDDRRVKGDIRKPDHWRGDRFHPKMARDPVLGVRADDAVVFCQWLTEQSPEAGVRYRLPTLDEAQNTPLEKAMDAGYWCRKDTDNFLFGISPSLSKKARVQLSQRIAEDCDRDKRLAEKFARECTHNADLEANFKVALREKLKDFLRENFFDVYVLPHTEAAIGHCLNYKVFVDTCRTHIYEQGRITGLDMVRVGDAVNKQVLAIALTDITGFASSREVAGFRDITKSNKDLLDAIALATELVSRYEPRLIDIIRQVKTAADDIANDIHWAVLTTNRILDIGRYVERALDHLHSYSYSKELYTSSDDLDKDFLVIQSRIFETPFLLYRMRSMLSVLVQVLSFLYAVSSGWKKKGSSGLQVVYNVLQINGLRKHKPYSPTLVEKY